MPLSSGALLRYIKMLSYYFCTESSPRTGGSGAGDDWRTAFDAAANGPTDLSRTPSRQYSDPAQNGDLNSGSGSSSNSRRTPTRLPPAPPSSGRY